MIKTCGYDFHQGKWRKRWLLVNGVWIDLVKRGTPEFFDISYVYNPTDRTPPTSFIRTPPIISFQRLLIQGSSTDIINGRKPTDKLQKTIEEIEALGAKVVCLHDNINITCSETVKDKVYDIWKSYMIDYVQQSIEDIGPLQPFPLTGQKWEDLK